MDRISQVRQAAYDAAMIALESRQVPAISKDREFIATYSGAVVAGGHLKDASETELQVMK